MKKALEHLWYDNFKEDIQYRELSAEKKELIKYIADHHDNLLSTLTDKQKELLEKFDDCNAELTEITEMEIFVYAFRLGARIAIDVMSFDAE